MTTYFCADLHLSHKNIIKWSRDFSTIEEHDAAIVGAINATVHPKDKLYILGDVAFASRQDMLGEISCRNIVVVLGNHDYPSKVESIQRYARVAGAIEYKGCILTHFPVHPYQAIRYRANIHGHSHGTVLPDPWYVNVSMERLEGYRPISFAQVIESTKEITQ